jgi:hypothetical protein
MSAIALTSSNLDFTKHSLRQRYLSVKSSHLAEALARACGHRTYATLLSDIQHRKPAMPAIARLDDRQFLERLATFGYNLRDQRPLSEFARSQELPDRLWCECKGRDIPTLDRWYSECVRRDIPHVYVMVRRKYALLNWDCITLAKKHDRITKGPNSAFLTRRLFEHCRRFLRPKAAVFEGSTFTGEIDPLYPETARDIADEVCIFLYQALTSDTKASAASAPRLPIFGHISFRPQDTDDMTEGQLAEYLAGTWDVIEDGGLGILVEGSPVKRSKRQPD